MLNEVGLHFIMLLTGKWSNSKKSCQNCRHFFHVGGGWSQQNSSQINAQSFTSRPLKKYLTFQVHRSSVI